MALKQPTDLVKKVLKLMVARGRDMGANEVKTQASSYKLARLPCRMCQRASGGQAPKDNHSFEIIALDIMGGNNRLGVNRMPK